MFIVCLMFFIHSLCKISACEKTVCIKYYRALGRRPYHQLFVISLWSQHWTPRDPVPPLSSHLFDTAILCSNPPEGNRCWLRRRTQRGGENEEKARDWSRWEPWNSTHFGGKEAGNLSPWLHSTVLQSKLCLFIRDVMNNQWTAVKRNHQSIVFWINSSVL